MASSKVALLVGTASTWAPLRTDWRNARSKMTSQQVATPTGIPAGLTTPVPLPGTKYPARSAYDDKRVKKARQGRYSPNGWTICLSWRSPGPRAGSHTMTVLEAAGLSCVASGWATTAPTRIGTPIARAATSICWAASALVSGSMSEEFSGQITNCGWGALPALTSSAS